MTTKSLRAIAKAIKSIEKAINFNQIDSENRSLSETRQNLFAILKHNKYEFLNQTTARIVKVPS